MFKSVQYQERTILNELLNTFCVLQLTFNNLNNLKIIANFVEDCM